MAVSINGTTGLIDANVSGTIQAGSVVTGDLIGNVTGDVNGNVTGNVNVGVVKFADNSTITKAPYTIFVPDARSGCPPTQPANTAINPVTFTLLRPATGVIWINTIVNHTTRADTILYLDNEELTRNLTSANSSAFKPVQLYWAGLIPAGSHTVDYRCNVANVIGCGGVWGQTMITLYEL
jgi:hypothetical protein